MGMHIIEDDDAIVGWWWKKEKGEKAKRRKVEGKQEGLHVRVSKMKMSVLWVGVR